jgi:hypothetical protein
MFAAAAVLSSASASAGEGPPPLAFEFVSTVLLPFPATGETRGFHFVLTDPGVSSNIVYGCGIAGEVVAIDFSDPSSPTVVGGDTGFPLIQSRTLLWDGPRLLVANKNLCFYEKANSSSSSSSGSSSTPSFPLQMFANLTTPMSGRSARYPDGKKQGVNGLVAVRDSNGTAIVVGAAMPGILVAARLHGADDGPSSTPFSVGSR